MTCAGVPCSRNDTTLITAIQRQEIPEQADDLRVPEPSHDGEPQHFAERQGDGCVTGRGHVGTDK